MEHLHEATLWAEFWGTFWDLGHVLNEIVWEIISYSVVFLLGRGWIRKHDTRHHHHSDHSEDSD